MSAEETVTLLCFLMLLSGLPMHPTAPAPDSLASEDVVNMYQMICQSACSQLTT